MFTVYGPEILFPDFFLSTMILMTLVSFNLLPLLELISGCENTLPTPQMKKCARNYIYSYMVFQLDCIPVVVLKNYEPRLYILNFITFQFEFSLKESYLLDC